MVEMYKYAGALLDNVYAHHLTLKFRPTDDEVADLSVGDFTTITVIGWAADEKAQALVCSVNEPCSNINPHITISTAIGAPS